jgi:hypothetical protein
MKTNLDNKQIYSSYQLLKNNFKKIESGGQNLLSKHAQPNNGGDWL